MNHLCGESLRKRHTHCSSSGFVAAGNSTGIRGTLHEDAVEVAERVDSHPIIGGSGRDGDRSLQEVAEKPKKKKGGKIPKVSVCGTV